ncbi:MAG: hypothetical protein WA383_08665 [Terriglobales bacterium]
MSDEQPKPQITFFFETTHGKYIRDALQRVGLQIKTHRNMGWLCNMLDTDIIAECGRQGWVMISGDKSIERVPEERQAVINARCKVFMFDDSHVTRTEDWAASLLVGRHRLIEIAEKADGPLFVTIRKCKVQGHLSQPRFIGLVGGGWKPAEPDTPKASADAQPGPEKPMRRQQQAKLEFPEPAKLDEKCDAVDQSEQIMSDLETQEMQREWLKELKEHHQKAASSTTIASAKSRSAK